MKTAHVLKQFDAWLATDRRSWHYTWVGRGVQFFKQSLEKACSGALIRTTLQNELPDPIAWSAERGRTDELGDGGTVGQQDEEASDHQPGPPSIQDARRPFRASYYLGGRDLDGRRLA